MGIKYIWSWDYFLYDDHQNISPNDEKIANFWNNYVKEHGMINPKWYVIFSSDDYDNNIKVTKIIMGFLATAVLLNRQPAGHKWPAEPD